MVKNYIILNFLSKNQSGFYSSKFFFCSSEWFLCSSTFGMRSSKENLSYLNLRAYLYDLKLFI